MRNGIKLAALILSLIFLQPVSAEPLRLAVAANFKATLTKLVIHYQEINGRQQIDIVPGSTGALTTQIIQGAPFHILFAADRSRPEELERRSLTRLRRTYATGQLAFWIRDPGHGEPVKEQTLRQYSGRLAVANPRHAPYGLAATQVLTKLTKEARHVYGNNVAQAFTFVTTGNVEAGMVSLSQVLEFGIPLESYWRVPESYHAPIEQQLVVMKNSPELAMHFFHWLMQPEAKQIVREAGYQVDGSDHDG